VFLYKNLKTSLVIKIFIPVETKSPTPPLPQYRKGTCDILLPPPSRKMPRFPFQPNRYRQVLQRCPTRLKLLSSFPPTNKRPARSASSDWKSLYRHIRGRKQSRRQCMKTIIAILPKGFLERNLLKCMMMGKPVCLKCYYSICASFFVPHNQISEVGLMPCGF
jgi:hypothetical protein